MNAVLIPAQVLLVSCVEPSRRSVSNHLLSPPGSGLVLTRSLPRGLPAAYLGTRASFGLHHHSEVGHDNRPKRVRHPTDQQFISSCSPPPLARTQLLSISTFRPNLARTFTLLIQHTYKRTSAAIHRRFRVWTGPPASPSGWRQAIVAGQKRRDQPPVGARAALQKIAARACRLRPQKAGRSLFGCSAMGRRRVAGEGAKPDALVEHAKNQLGLTCHAQLLIKAAKIRVHGVGGDPQLMRHRKPRFALE